MPDLLSADVCVRFEVLFAQGLTGREIGRPLISETSASTRSQTLKAGLRLTPADNPRDTRHGRLAPYHDVLIERIHHDPNVTLRALLRALVDAYGVTASVSGMAQREPRPRSQARGHPS